MATTLPIRTWLDLPAPFRAPLASTLACYDKEANCWQVFRYEDVLRVATDHASFSSESRQRMLARGDEAGADEAVVPLLDSLINMDPPRHRQFRSLVAQAFTPRAIAQMAPRITCIANELLDRVIPQG